MASDSVLMTFSNLVQRPTAFRVCSEPPSESTFQALGLSRYCATRALNSPSVPGGDHVPEPQPHPARIADLALGEPEILVARHPGFEQEAVGGRHEVTGVLVVVGGLGPGVLGLGEVLLSVERQ